MGEENKQAMNLPAVNLTDGDSTMPMPTPEPGSYFRLTREYDIAAAARAQEIHAKNVERYEHQQKYIKDHPGHVRDSDLKSNPGECPAYIPVAGTVMLVIDQQSSDPPLLRSMNAKKKEIRSTMKTEANPNLAFVPEEEKTKKYNTRVAYAIASFGFMLTGIMTFVIHLGIWNATPYILSGGMAVSCFVWAITILERAIKQTGKDVQGDYMTTLGFAIGGFILGSIIFMVAWNWGHPGESTPKIQESCATHQGMLEHKYLGEGRNTTIYVLCRDGHNFTE